MTFGAETITKSKVATGHVEFAINDKSVSTGANIRRLIGRVTEISDVATGATLYTHKGYNASGAKQNVAHFLTELGSGDYTVTLDEIQDFDSATWAGEQVDVAFRQGFHQDAGATLGVTAVAWRMLASTALIIVKSIKTNFDTPSTAVLEIHPYATAGVAPWQIDNAYAV